jgi:hypothetical protein
VGAEGTSGADGVYASSDSGTGVHGESTSGRGIEGLSYTTGQGVLGLSGSGTGVHGESGTGPGVLGVTERGTGILGIGGGSIEAINLHSLAGDFHGDVHVSGKLMKDGGGFQIDHPLDPAHKSLSHSFVESPDMKNLYDGVVVLDANGEAEIELPSWFEALTTEFRYQLTPIGASAPELYIAEKIQGNRFRIAGGKPAMEVCWQVTGIRQDAWAKAHRIPVEQDKPAHEQGYYRHPDLYGEPEEKSLLRARYPELKTPVPPKQ